MKRILIALMLLTGVLRADDCKLVCELGLGAVDRMTQNVNDLRNKGYEISGNMSQCWIESGSVNKISLCQWLIKKDVKPKAKPKNIKHEYWIIRNSDADKFQVDVEDMINKGWKLAGSISSSCAPTGYNWLVQPLAKDVEVDAKTDTKSAEKKP